MPNAAPHKSSALSSVASNTGARSPGDPLMTCKTSAVAVCCSRASSRSAIAPSRSALNSASCRCRSAIRRSFGSANVLSGGALICGPRRDQCPQHRSYPDRRGPPQVVDRDSQFTSVNDHQRACPISSARPMNGQFWRIRVTAPRARRGCFTVPLRTLPAADGADSPCPRSCPLLPASRSRDPSRPCKNSFGRRF